MPYCELEKMVRVVASPLNEMTPNLVWTRSNESTMSLANCFMSDIEPDIEPDSSSTSTMSISLSHIGDSGGEGGGGEGGEGGGESAPRTPQSWQSVPYWQPEYSAPAPPSSQ